MKRLLAVLLALAACNYDPVAQVSVDAAETITRDYEPRSLKAYAAGSDCLVLLVRASTRLNDTAVETLHYGNGESLLHPGGLQQFAAAKKFRAVAYRDSDGNLWTYGSITRQEAQSMRTCP